MRTIQSTPGDGKPGCSDGRASARLLDLRKGIFLARIDELLSPSRLDAGYGHVTVIRSGAISVSPSDVVGFIGRNGAGKTTFISAIMGLIPSSAGSARLLDALQPNACANVRPEVGWRCLKL